MQLAPPTEDLLYYLWQLRAFDTTDLATTAGEPVEVLHPGYRNTGSGPDFSDVRLKINGINWSGHAEMHINSSDWYLHKHQNDKAYDSVVLHVVWQHNKEVQRSNGSTIPTIELQQRVPAKLLLQYQKLLTVAAPFPCAPQLATVPDLQRYAMLDTALAVRLQHKADEVLQLHQHTGQHWEQTAYQLLARAFGFKTNSQPMQQLATSVPLKLVQQYSTQPKL